MAERALEARRLAEAGNLVTIGRSATDQKRHRTTGVVERPRGRRLMVSGDADDEVARKKPIEVRRERGIQDLSDLALALGGLAVSRPVRPLGVDVSEPVAVIEHVQC